jgi:hypothetical protein
VKINEIRPQLYEGIGSTLIQKGANWLGKKLGSAITSSTNIESQTAKIFAKNFVDKTNAGLASAGTMINSPLAKQKFISKMVAAYMKGVDMSAYQQEVDNAILNASNGSPNSLEDLGKLLYAVSITASANPQQAPIATPKVAPKVRAAPVKKATTTRKPKVAPVTNPNAVSVGGVTSPANDPATARLLALAKQQGKI